MPMAPAFARRLNPLLPEIVAAVGTPFHIYDEAGIRETGRRLSEAFSGFDGFREYFAVKALPNPRILQIMRDMGFGFDCSSIAEPRPEPPSAAGVTISCSPPTTPLPTNSPLPLPTMAAF